MRSMIIIQIYVIGTRFMIPPVIKYYKIIEKKNYLTLRMFVKSINKHFSVKILKWSIF